MCTVSRRDHVVTIYQQTKDNQYTNRSPVVQTLTITSLTPPAFEKLPWGQLCRPHSLNALTKGCCQTAGGYSQWLKGSSRLIHTSCRMFGTHTCRCLRWHTCVTGPRLKDASRCVHVNNGLSVGRAKPLSQSPDHASGRQATQLSYQFVLDRGRLAHRRHALNGHIG